MRSLFVQLWVAFLAVMALTLSASLCVSYVTALKRSEGADQLSPAVLAASAQPALRSGGVEGLSSWALDELHRQPEVLVYFIDRDGHDVFNRPIRGQPIASSIGHPPPVISGADGTRFQVHVNRTRGLVFDFWTILFRPWLLIPLILTISGLGCTALAWLLSMPIRRLRSSVRQVAGGNLDVRIEHDLMTRRDEFGGLARDFQQMTHDLRGLIDSKEALLRDVSHELRSPLARLRLAADLARDKVGDRALAFARIEREVERIDAMISQILHFSRVGSSDDASSGTFSVVAVVRGCVEDARIEADKRRLFLNLTTAGEATVHGSEAQVRTAIENVLRNAIRHAPNGSSIAISTMLTQDGISIEIADQGRGTASSNANWVFEPFRRGEGSDGVGLGLSITKRIAEIHGGTARARNASPGFVVQLSFRSANG